MKRLWMVGFLVLSIGGVAAGQWHRTTLERVRKIKLLESTRDDVKRTLAEYEASDDDDHFQEFSIEDVTVEVSYASGICSDDADERDSSNIWKAPEWRVTRVAVTFEDPVKLEDIGMTLSELTKEQRDEDDPEDFLLYSKSLGLIVETDEDGVGEITFIPPQSNSGKLCNNAAAARKFYSSNTKLVESGFVRRNIVDANYPANVTALELSATEIRTLSNRLISVEATATDPENDVLTYTYTVSGGVIRGTGAKVVWDLTTVQPGNYAITAGVDDGCGICGKTITKTVMVK